MSLSVFSYVFDTRIDLIIDVPAEGAVYTVVLPLKTAFAFVYVFVVAI